MPPLCVQTLKAAEEHLMRATCERSFYPTAVKECRDAVQHHFTTNGSLHIPAPGSMLALGSGPDTVHYSYDFAQQVHYPHDPLQPGPMYFKTARKCAIFGVCCEGIPRQINYLMRHPTPERGPTQSSACSITSCNTMVLER